MKVDEEIVIARVGEETRSFLPNARFGKLRQNRHDSLSKRLHFLITNVAIHHIRIWNNLSRMHDARFHSALEPWKAIGNVSRFVLVRPNRKLLPSIRLPVDIEPENRLSLDFERHTFSPCADTQHEMIRGECRMRCLYLYTVVGCGPGFEELFKVKIGAVLCSNLEMFAVALFGIEPPRPGVTHSDEI